MNPFRFRRLTDTGTDMRSFFFLGATLASALILAGWGRDPRWLGLWAAGAVYALALALGGGWRWRRKRKGTHTHSSGSGSDFVELLGLLAAAGAAYALGFRVTFIRDFDGAYLSLGVWSLPLTLVWVVAVARSLRFAHELGGGRLVVRLAWVACGAFLAINLLQGSLHLPFALTLVLLLLGGLTLLLIRAVSLSPAAGQGLGILIALLAVAGVLKTTATLTLIAPVAILGLSPLATRFGVAYTQLLSPGRARPRHRGQALLGLYAALSGVGVLAVLVDRRPDLLGPALIGLGTGAGVAALWGSVLVPAARAHAEGAWTFTDRRVRLWRVPLDRLPLEEVLERAQAFVRSRRPHVIATPDTTALMRARRDARLRAAYERADLVTPDGTGLVWASRWLGAPLPERVTGIDLMEALCRRAAVEGYRVFLLGARPGIAERAAARLKDRFPGLQIAGTHHGYFGSGGAGAGERQVLSKIRAARPDLLFVGLGVPRQDVWLARWRDRLGVPVMMGVGGSLDVIAGRLPRAPLSWQRMGLEWLYRLFREPRPRRLTRALLIPLFLWEVARLRLALRIQRSRSRDLGPHRSTGWSTSAKSN